MESGSGVAAFRGDTRVGLHRAGCARVAPTRASRTYRAASAYRAASIGALLLLAACGGGAEEGGGPIGGGDPGEPIGSDGSMDGWPPVSGWMTVPPMTLAAGAEIGALEVVLPNASEFVLHGTLPLPRNAYHDQNGTWPFAIVDYDGTLVPAQVEVVTRYAADSFGASVVELLAKVRRNPGVAPGTRTTYRVEKLSSPVSADVGGDSVLSLQSVPDDVPAEVQTLLASASSILITAHDCFGNLYVSQPLAGGSHKDLLRCGPAQATLRTYDTMVPTPPVGGPTATLPHLFGAHAYLSTWSGIPVIGFDLRLNNGADGYDDGSAIDDPLGKAYFSEIEIVVPTGWAVVQDVEDPFFETGYVLGAVTVFPIVAPNPAGKMHVMPSQGQLFRRLALAPLAEIQRARSMLEMEGLGFARDGYDPQTSQRYASWWHPSTARYFPQSHTLPKLDHYGLDNVRNFLTGELNYAKNHLQNGTSGGLYPIKSSVLGWAHPWGVEYGGMTGGAEIHIFEGVEALVSASVEGYRSLQLQQRMHNDRQRSCFYDQYGDQTHLEKWLVPSGGSSYAPFSFYMQLLPGADPFGLTSAPTFQVNYVSSAGLKPTYENALLSYEPSDQHHLVRYTRSPKALVWIGNDMPSKDDLRMQAELFRMSYHPFANAASGYVQGGGMKYFQNYVAAHPANGFEFGRGEGWGFDASNAYYQMANDAWRDQVRYWYDAGAKLISDGQIDCTGFVQALISGSFLEGKYRSRQMIEQSIFENALRGMVESVYLGESSAHTVMLANVLAGSFHSMVSHMAWSDALHGPFMKAAVGPLNENLPAWCGYLPGDGYVPYIDNYQEWSSLAYAYELTGNPIYLSKAANMAWNGDLLMAMQSAGLNNIQNKAALLALVQELQ